MRKSLKGIIVGAIATFVFAPAVFAKEVSEVNITIAAPKAGDKLIAASTTCSSKIYSGPEDTEGTLFEYPCVQTTPEPTVTFGDSTYVMDTLDGKAIWLKKLPSQATANPMDNYDEFDAELHYYEDAEVTFEEGKDYYVEVPVLINNMEENEFSPNVVVKVNGSTTGFEVSGLEQGVSSVRFIVYAKVTAEKTAEETVEKTKTEETTSTEATKETYKVLDGDNQKYDATSNDRLTFRFNIEYSEFQQSGKVYMDGELVDASNYETKEGSTIVIFTKSYTNLLKTGNHTTKVTTNNGEVSTNFTITKAVANPKTSDSIISSMILILISFISLTILLKNKKALN